MLRNLLRVQVGMLPETKDETSRENGEAFGFTLGNPISGSRELQQLRNFRPSRLPNLGTIENSNA